MSESGLQADIVRLGNELKNHARRLDNHYRNVEAEADKVVRVVVGWRVTALVVAGWSVAMFWAGTHF